MCTFALYDKEWSMVMVTALNRSYGYLEEAQWSGKRM
jgi:hypothetical protein